MEAGQTELNAYTLKENTQREMLAAIKTTEI
jgi:hypothetical protein